jgi:hypothetical protein
MDIPVFQVEVVTFQRVSAQLTPTNKRIFEHSSDTRSVRSSSVMLGTLIPIPGDPGISESA